MVKWFPGVRALDGVDFEVRGGEVHVLLGENGAGKSTLMNVLGGACRADAGTIRIDGCREEIRTPQEARRLGINTIHQEFTLVPQLTVAANLFLGREPGPGWGLLDREGMIARAAELLAEMGIPINPSVRVGALGVAQQQMVEVARALAFEARILVMDEPTSALAPAEIQTLFGLIRRVRSRGVGVIYISHRLEEIFALGDRVTVLRDGRQVATRPMAGVTTAELIRLMADREVTEHYPRRPVAPGEPLLEVAGLSTRDKLRDVNFTLHRGEILGVAGLLGSGRSTLARALFGAEPVVSGRVLRRGSCRRVASPGAAVGQGLGLLPEDRKRDGLVLGLSVEANLGLPSPETVYPWGWFSAVASGRLAGRQVDQLRIRTPGLGQRVGRLSGGNQQKVVLGKWLARAAEVLVFDEPTRGIDVAAKVDIYELMNRATAAGAGILMISSDLPEVVGMSDRILVLRQGRVASELARSEASQERVLRAAFGEAA